MFIQLKDYRINTDNIAYYTPIKMGGRDYAIMFLMTDSASSFEIEFGDKEDDKRQRDNMLFTLDKMLKLQ